MATRMQQRRGTSEEWISSNPVLANGEIGYITDFRAIKIGDGNTLWQDLPLLFESLYASKSAFDALSANVDALIDNVAQLNAGNIFFQRNVGDPFTRSGNLYVSAGGELPLAGTFPDGSIGFRKNEGIYDVFIGLDNAWTSAGLGGGSIVTDGTAEPTMPDPVKDESIRYVAPTAIGTGDGTTAANAAGGLISIKSLATVATNVRVIADRGNYSATTVDMTSANCTIEGVKSDGVTPMKATIVGSRVFPYDPAFADSGSATFRFLTGANGLVFRNFRFEHVEEAFTFRNNVSNITIEDMEFFNVRRFIDAPNSLLSGASVNGCKVLRCKGVGFSKQFARFQYDSANILIEDCDADSAKQDGDNFAMGIFFDGSAHDIIIRRTRIGNCIQTNRASTDYWNGDALVAEEQNYNILVEDCEFYGCTDGGVDLKSAKTILRRVYSHGNKRNYRFWAPDAIMEACRGENAFKLGGSGSGVSGIWLGKPRTQIDGTIGSGGVTIKDSVITEDKDNHYIFNVEMGARITLHRTKVNLMDINRKIKVEGSPFTFEQNDTVYNIVTAGQITGATATPLPSPDTATAPPALPAVSNLLPKDLEDGSGGGWNSAATITLNSKEESLYGGQSVKLVPSTSSSMTSKLSGPVLVEGRRYTIGASVLLKSQVDPTTAKEGYIRADTKAADGSHIGNTGSSTRYPLTAGTWVHVSRSFTAAVGVQQIRLVAALSGSSTGDVYHWDNFWLAEGDYDRGAYVPTTEVEVDEPIMATDANTGLYVGTELTPYMDNFQSTSDGQVVRGLDIYGFVTLSHSNVVFENNRVRGGVTTTSRGLINSTGVGNKIVHNELIPSTPSQYLEGVVGEHYTAKWNKIRDVVDYFRLGANNKIWNNFCRDLTYFTPCSYQSDNQTHNDAVQLNPTAKNWNVQYNDFGAKYGPRGSHQPSHFTGPTPAGQTYPDCSVLMFGSSLKANGFTGAQGGKFNNNICRGGFQPINAGADSLATLDLGQFHRNQFDGDSFGGPGMTTATHTLDFDPGVIKDSGEGTTNANRFFNGTEVLVRTNQ